MNKAILIGRLGADPESRRMNNGKPVVNFRLATSERWKDKQSGERKETTEWHQCVCFNEALCGVIENYLKKGSQVMIEGKIKTRKWEKDGVDRYTTEIVIESFGGSLELLGSKNGERGEAEEPEERSGRYSMRDEKPKRQPTPGGGSTAVDYDDDIPFAPEWR